MFTHARIGCNSNPCVSIKNILTFEIELVNRNNSSRILKVIVDYDLKEIKNRIETHMKFSAQHGGVDLKALSENFHSKTADQVKDACANCRAQVVT